MGAELWEFTAAFESESDTVKTILAKHKTEIMALDGNDAMAILRR